MDKEKRLIRFLLASSLVMLAFLQIQQIRNPPKPIDDPAEIAEAEVNEEAFADNAGDAIAANEADTADGDAADVEPAGEIEPQRITLGSLDPTSPYQMAVSFTNQGAAIERIELNNPRYQDLDDKSGYLGFLGLTDDPIGGCRVTQVTPGSPAESAGISAGTKPGEGDRIVKIDSTEVADAESFRVAFSKTRPGDEVDLTIMRGANGVRKTLKAKLVKRPLSLISPEPVTPTEEDPQHPRSFLWTLGKVGDAKVGLGKDEIAQLPSLHTANWEMKRLPDDGSLGEGVEFSRRLTKAELSQVGGKVPLEMVKRYRLTRTDRSEEAVKRDKHGSEGYGIQLEMEIRNLGNADQRLAYQLDGPTGLPLEGWWYSYKVHPTAWSGAGARDVVWEEPDTGKHGMKTGSMIAAEYEEDSKEKYKGLFEATKPTRLNYIGCDAQYFTVALVPPKPLKGQPVESIKTHRFAKAFAQPVGPIDKKKKKRTDVSFRVTSRDVTVPGGEAFKESFTIFAGPKEPDVLKKYGLEKCIVYGWFGAVAKPMIGILHFFHDKIRLSWGLSIVALTILVRLLMYPIGRKMALNAQKMQELAPEMKKIADKYKDNLEKRSAAQQELFKKNNYNPAAGCLMMPLQMPIFVGLYRGLSVDIGLRQAPFFEGMSWCSNLAGPDKFWHWENVVPNMMGSPEGFLGPFLNVLPFITVLLFLVQQILFTPPPQDENQATQQQVMKFMMIFMGLMFHKVAAGLCIYMIASSLWGIAERKLLPKTKKPEVAVAGAGGETVAAKSSSFFSSSENGSSNGSKTATKKKKRKKKKRRK